MRVLSRLGVIIATPLFIFTLSFIAHAQKKDAIDKSPPKSGYGSVSGPTTSGPKVVERIVRVTPTTGALTIVAEPGASVRLEPLTRGGLPKRCKISADERSCVIEDLRPGNYRAVAELNGYKTARGEKIVKANKSDTV